MRIELFESFCNEKVLQQSNIGIIENDNPRTEGQGLILMKLYLITCSDNVSLYGYFQTEKYFKNIEEEDS